MEIDMEREGYNNNPTLNNLEGPHGKMATPENNRELPVNDIRISGTVEELFVHIKTTEEETGQSITCAKIIEIGENDEAGTIAATYEKLQKDIDHNFKKWGFPAEEYEPHLYKLNQAS